MVLPAASEAVLIRQCAGLYGSFASEAASSLTLVLMFSYIVLLLSVKGQIKTPGLAVFNLVTVKLTEILTDFINTIKKWSDMPTLPLPERFAFCRKLNMSICTFSAFTGLVAITRWFHFGNINGFRYLGYCFTCPIIQGELIALLAPIVPCYTLTQLVSATVTAVCMLSGYYGSLYAGPMWDGDFGQFLQDWDMEKLQMTEKGWAMLPSWICFGFLMGIQGPYLGLLYTCCYRKASEDLPKKFMLLIYLITITWVGFPLWWVLSAEGFSIIKDTKANGWGFVLLNISSKGGFTFCMLTIVAASRKQAPPKPDFKSASVPYWLYVLQEYDTEKHFDTFDPHENEDKQLEDEQDGGHVYNTGMPEMQSGGMSPPKTNTWDGLEEDYKVFLLQSGVTAATFEQCNVLDKVTMRKRYRDSLKRQQMIEMGGGDKLAMMAPYGEVNDKDTFWLQM
jgi:hypothetical protein